MNEKETDALVDRVTKALDVPEPSPLFWDHFPRRVRAAAHAAPAEPPRVWWKRPALALAVCLALAAGLVPLTVARWGAVVGDAPPVVSDGAVPTSDVESLDEESGWAIVSAVAASAGVEGLKEAGFGVSPGGADAMLEDLTAAERAELAALLAAEMKGGDSGGL